MVNSPMSRSEPEVLLYDAISSSFCHQDKERGGRPEELVRLEDSAAALVAEQSEVAAQLGGVSGEALLDATAAQVPHFQHSAAASCPGWQAC